MTTKLRVWTGLLLLIANRAAFAEPNLLVNGDGGPDR